MKTPFRIVCGHPVRLALAAGLVVLSVAGSAGMAQQVGPPTGGTSWGLGRGGVSGNEKYLPPPTMRAVQGVVQNSKGEVIKGAMVYLKNERTSKLQSVSVDETGKFRFVQVPLKDDFKLWAQAADKKSPEKVISSFDTKTEVTRDLKVE
ncbi:carboxypeptidase-like regulatory domain-containing protein [Terriglobus roseus]|nr:carboxypeptidase-like regulatory domain-containing protein [Terriglobus roseus]